jgi:hypothetical protein
MTFTLPSVSTLERRRTITFRFTILWTPRARPSVMTAGRPSGTAATAKLTERKKASTRSPRRRACVTKTTVTTPRQSPTSAFPNAAMRRSSGVISGGSRWRSPAILPSSVRMPVAVTIASPFPAVATEPK